MLLADIALPLPIPKLYTYRIPAHLENLAQTGMRVRVPLRKRNLTGVIFKLHKDQPEHFEPRPILCLLEEEPIFTPSLLELAFWVADYYQAPLGMVLQAILPGPYLGSRQPQYRLRKGVLALAPFLTPEEEELVQKLLSSPTGLKAQEIQPHPHLFQALLSLKEKNLIEEHHPGGKRVVTFRLYSLSPVGSQMDLKELDRSPKQKAILSLMREQKRPLTLREITQWAGVSPSTIQALVKKGYLFTTLQVVPQRLETFRLPKVSQSFHTLTEDQEKIFIRISKALSKGSFEVFLIEGVTGSGKSEIYFHCIQKAISAGKKALYLVPEVVLSPQVVERVSTLFGKRVAVLHSYLNEAERVDQYEKIRKGEVDVVVGARSAVFAPLSDLGLIIVDEEQSRTYKASECPTYHARDVAVKRGQMEKAVVILGSATPSLESRYNVQRKKYHHGLLPRRVFAQPLPKTHIVDMRQEPLEDSGEVPIFSKDLMEAMKDTFTRGEQAILFIPRRGYSPQLYCRYCGENFPCPACSVPKVVHKKVKKLICHYCNHSSPLPSLCPQCQKPLLTFRGYATERVVEAFSQLFPEVPHARMDRDTVSKRGKMREILSRFQHGKVQCLIGTQLVTKGHHFPRVTLIGILSMDYILFLPDFRASESCFSLLTQVSGRAGRGEKPGVVFIQTTNPTHYAIQYGIQQDFPSFYQKEIALRRVLKFPPVYPMAQIRIEGKEQKNTLKKAAFIADSLSRHPLHAQVLQAGPHPAFHERLRHTWRYQILLRASSRKTLQTLLKEAVLPHTGKGVMIDVDPYDLL